jgi:hypothetical protein
MFPWTTTLFSKFHDTNQREDLVLRLPPPPPLFPTDGCQPASLFIICIRFRSSTTFRSADVIWTEIFTLAIYIYIVMLIQYDMSLYWINPQRGYINLNLLQCVRRSELATLQFCTSCQKQRSLGRSPTGKQIAEILGDGDIMYFHNVAAVANKKWWMISQNF